MCVCILCKRVGLSAKDVAITMWSLTTHLHNVRSSRGIHLFPHTPSRRTQGQLDLYLTHGLSAECKRENLTWKTAQRVEEGNELLCGSSGR